MNEEEEYIRTLIFTNSKTETPFRRPASRTLPRVPRRVQNKLKRPWKSPEKGQKVEMLGLEDSPKEAQGGINRGIFFRVEARKGTEDSLERNSVEKSEKITEYQLDGKKRSIFHNNSKKLLPVEPEHQIHDKIAKSEILTHSKLIKKANWTHPEQDPKSTKNEVTEVSEGSKGPSEGRKLAESSSASSDSLDRMLRCAQNRVQYESFAEDQTYGEGYYESSGSSSNQGGPSDAVLGPLRVKMGDPGFDLSGPFEGRREAPGPRFGEIEQPERDPYEYLDSKSVVNVFKGLSGEDNYPLKEKIGNTLLEVDGPGGGAGKARTSSEYKTRPKNEPSARNSKIAKNANSGSNLNKKGTKLAKTGLGQPSSGKKPQSGSKNPQKIEKTEISEKQPEFSQFSIKVLNSLTRQLIPEILENERTIIGYIDQKTQKFINLESDYSSRIRSRIGRRYKVLLTETTGKRQGRLDARIKFHAMPEKLILSLGPGDKYRAQELKEGLGLILGYIDKTSLGFIDSSDVLGGPGRLSFSSGGFGSTGRFEASGSVFGGEETAREVDGVAERSGNIFKRFSAAEEPNLDKSDFGAFSAPRDTNHRSFGSKGLNRGSEGWGMPTFDSKSQKSAFSPHQKSSQNRANPDNFEGSEEHSDLKLGQFDTLATSNQQKMPEFCQTLKSKENLKFGYETPQKALPLANSTSFKIERSARSRVKASPTSSYPIIQNILQTQTEPSDAPESGSEAVSEHSEHTKTSKGGLSVSRRLNFDEANLTIRESKHYSETNDRGFESQDDLNESILCQIYCPGGEPRRQNSIKVDNLKLEINQNLEASSRILDNCVAIGTARSSRVIDCPPEGASEDEKIENFLSENLEEKMIEKALESSRSAIEHSTGRFGLPSMPSTARNHKNGQDSNAKKIFKNGFPDDPQGHSNHAKPPSYPKESHSSHQTSPVLDLDPEILKTETFGDHSQNTEILIKNGALSTRRTRNSKRSQKWPNRAPETSKMTKTTKIVISELLPGEEATETFARDYGFFESGDQTGGVTLRKFRDLRISITQKEDIQNLGVLDQAEVFGEQKEPTLEAGMRSGEDREARGMFSRDLSDYGHFRGKGFFEGLRTSPAERLSMERFKRRSAARKSIREADLAQKSLTERPIQSTQKTPKNLFSDQYEHQNHQEMHQAYPTTSRERHQPHQTPKKVEKSPLKQNSKNSKNSTFFNKTLESSGQIDYIDTRGLLPESLLAPGQQQDEQKVFSSSNYRSPCSSNYRPPSSTQSGLRGVRGRSSTKKSHHRSCSSSSYRKPPLEGKSQKKHFLMTERSSANKRRKMMTDRGRRSPDHGLYSRFSRQKGYEGVRGEKMENAQNSKLERGKDFETLPKESWTRIECTRAPVNVSGASERGFRLNFSKKENTENLHFLGSRKDSDVSYENFGEGNAVSTVKKSTEAQEIREMRKSFETKNRGYKRSQKEEQLEKVITNLTEFIDVQLTSPRPQICEKYEEMKIPKNSLKSIQQVNESDFTSLESLEYTKLPEIERTSGCLLHICHQVEEGKIDQNGFKRPLFQTEIIKEVRTRTLHSEKVKFMKNKILRGFVEKKAKRRKRSISRHHRPPRGSVGGGEVSGSGRKRSKRPESRLSQYEYVYHIERDCVDSEGFDASDRASEILNRSGIAQGLDLGAGNRLDEVRSGGKERAISSARQTISRSPEEEYSSVLSFKQPLNSQKPVLRGGGESVTFSTKKGFKRFEY